MEKNEGYDIEADEEWREVLPGRVGEDLLAPLSERRVRLWSLVLDSRSVPCRIEHDGQAWRLMAPAHAHAIAVNELDLFLEENRDWPPPLPPQRPLLENTLATLSVLILLAVFHNIVQLEVALPDGYVPDWQAIGGGWSEKIREGQWWRLVTALTLHADGAHLLGNLAIGGVFVLILCRELGSGLAWSLLLASGALGNLVNAWLQSPLHHSVGASTGVFGAVGLLAAISLVRYRKRLRHRWPLPLAAALALLTLLGTEGKNTDLGAHLFGLLGGVFLGLITGYLLDRYGRPGRRLSRLLALATAVVTLVSWLAALASGMRSSLP